MYLQQYTVQAYKNSHIVQTCAFEDSTINRISLRPDLTVYLDQFKKQKFLEEWKNAILQRK